MERIKQDNETILEKTIIEIALSAGKITKNESFDYKLGPVESYSGDDVVELDGNKYKVIGHALQTLEGRIIKKGWIQVYKMRDWQE